MAASRASASPPKATRGITRAGTPCRAATWSARTPGRLLTTRTGSTPASSPLATASSTASRFEPLPETRTPSLIGAGLAEADAGPVSTGGDDPAHQARLRERAPGLIGQSGWDDRGEADTQVEGANHLLVRHVAALLDEREDRRHLPRPGLDLNAQAGRQRARDVLDPAAAGEVGEGRHVAADRAQGATHQP